jgi:hypothetical protein
MTTDLALLASLQSMKLLERYVYCNKKKVLAMCNKKNERRNTGGADKELDVQYMILHIYTQCATHKGTTKGMLAGFHPR